MREEKAMNSDIEHDDLQALEKLWSEKTDEQLKLDRQLREKADEIERIARRIAAAKAAA